LHCRGRGGERRGLIVGSAPLRLDKFGQVWTHFQFFII
jgi:hypothetical protein